MRRISLILTGAILCAVLAFAGTAAAKPATRTCTTQSKNVVNPRVKGHMLVRNVNAVQKQYATCAQAKKAMNRILSQGIEKPVAVAGYYCEPTVEMSNPNVVRYRCVFKGADTPMFVRLAFKVRYASN